MMQYIKRLSRWTLAVVFVSLASVAALGLEMDPTADFSFSMARQAQGSLNSESYSLMSEKSVARVLQDRLDVFPKSQTQKLARHLLELCKKHRFDPALILSLVRVESAFKVKARSSVGALGLMQVMPDTAEYISRKHRLKYTGARSLKDPFINLSIGVTYLAYLREQYYQEQSPYFLFAAYNMGPGRLEQLRTQKGKRFKGTKTKEYYEAIRRGVPALRSYPGTVVSKGA